MCRDRVVQEIEQMDRIVLKKDGKNKAPTSIKDSAAQTDIVQVYVLQ